MRLFRSNRKYCKRRALVIYGTCHFSRHLVSHIPTFCAFVKLNCLRKTFIAISTCVDFCIKLVKVPFCSVYFYKLLKSSYLMLKVALKSNSFYHFCILQVLTVFSYFGGWFQNLFPTKFFSVKALLPGKNIEKISVVTFLSVQRA